MTSWAQDAREHHAAATYANQRAAEHRNQRNHAIRRLRAENPQRWTYAAIAQTVGCGPELVAKIIQETE